MYDFYYRIEDTYWWFAGMRSIYRSVIKDAYGNEKTLRILDIGCGTGRAMKDLKEFGDVIGLDIEIEALEFCRKRGMRNLVRGDGVSLPFKDKAFDLITSFSVIEHIDDDAGFIKELYRISKDNARIIIATSAFDFLWSGHDAANRHKRRYTKGNLRGIINKHFAVEKITYTNFFLFPVIWIGIVINNLLKGKSSGESSGFYRVPGFLNNILIFVLKTEACLLRKINFPFGVSLLCIAKKDQKKSS